MLQPLKRLRDLVEGENGGNDNQYCGGTAAAGFDGTNRWLSAPLQ